MVKMVLLSIHEIKIFPCVWRLFIGFKTFTMWLINEACHIAQIELEKRFMNLTMIQQLQKWNDKMISSPSIWCVQSNTKTKSTFSMLCYIFWAVKSAQSL